MVDVGGGTRVGVGGWLVGCASTGRDPRRGFEGAAALRSKSWVSALGGVAGDAGGTAASCIAWFRVSGFGFRV
jgi:hypothetical protein